MIRAPLIMVQARMASSRLTGKVLREIDGWSMLRWVVERCRRSRSARGVVLLTSDLGRDDPIAAAGDDMDCPVYRGREEDVLLRYVEAARELQEVSLIRVTADCPFIDPVTIDEVISLSREGTPDYACVAGYPEGLGEAEYIRVAALESALERTTPAERNYREHVITYLLDNPTEFDLVFAEAPSHLRDEGSHFSIDTADDLELARKIAGRFRPSRDFGVPDILGSFRSRRDADPRDSEVLP